MTKSIKPPQRRKHQTKQSFFTAAEQATDRLFAASAVRLRLLAKRLPTLDNTEALIAEAIKATHAVEMRVRYLRKRASTVRTKRAEQELLVEAMRLELLLSRG